MKVLADECCPRVVVEAMRRIGLDVHYAAETDAQSLDTDLLAMANAEARIIVTEDFDFGDLLLRDRLPAVGAIIVFLPELSFRMRVQICSQSILQSPGLTFTGKLTMIATPGQTTSAALASAVDMEARAILCAVLRRKEGLAFETAAACLRALTAHRRRTPSEALQREGRAER